MTPEPDYTDNQNRHDFGPNDPYGKHSDFDAEHDFANASGQTANPANHRPDRFPDESANAQQGDRQAGPLDPDDKTDSLTDDEPHDADPEQTKPGQRRTGSPTSE